MKYLEQLILMTNLSFSLNLGYLLLSSVPIVSAYSFIFWSNFFFYRKLIIDWGIFHICDLTFADKSNLNLVNIHVKEKVFKCITCDTSFSLKCEKKLRKKNIKQKQKKLWQRSPKNTLILKIEASPHSF